MAKLTEVLFVVADDAQPHRYGNMRIDVLGQVDGETVSLGTIYLPHTVVPMLRGFVDDLVPHVIPGVVVYWGGVRVDPVKPPSIVAKAVALARKMNLLGAAT